MKKFWWLLLLFFSLAACQNSRPVINSVLIGGQNIKLELADTNESRALGLGRRDWLAPDAGMLFIFSDYQVRNFWMKEMRFPLDIIWLKDNQIVGFVQNVPAPTSHQLIIYQSDQPVNYVLELKAGWLEKNQVQAGDKVEFLTD